VARRGENEDNGDYVSQVRPQLAGIINERLDTLIGAGVTGADLIIATIGAGLRAYTQFARVEMPNGDELDAKTYLAEVEREGVNRKEKGEYCVRSPNNPDWNGGCYKSKGEAEGRLKEVEYFKHHSASLVERVIRRFQAGAPLDEKMQALLLKLRKGADSSLTIPQFFKVIDFLGGWRHEEIVGITPIHYPRGEVEHEMLQHVRSDDEGVFSLRRNFFADCEPVHSPVAQGVV